MRKPFLFLLSFIIILSTLPLTAVESVAQPKNAVPDGYIGIYTIEDLYCINDDMSAKYILMNDIDLTEATTEGGDWDFGGRGWNPIGSENIYTDTPFTGEFDGNNHSITGMKIRITSWPSGTGNGRCAGLFSCVNGYVHNLSFIGCSIYVLEAQTKYDQLGCLCGEILSNGHIKNISTDNTSTVTFRTSNNVISGTFVGGICGINYGFIEMCSNSSGISATFVPSDATRGNAGGVCGINKSSGTIENCYNSGNISYNGNHNGGISGYSDITKVITNCYNVGSAKYGICSKEVANCYYLAGTGIGCTGATELTAAQMKLKPMYRNFDFESIWAMSTDESYPYPVFITITFVESVSFSENEITLYTGDTQSLEYTVLPDNATDNTVRFESSDSSVLSVDESGTVTALKKGTATVTITTTDGSLTDTCIFNVLCSHRNTTVYPQTDSTCSVHGHSAYTICNDCGEVISGDNTELPLLEHSNLSTTTVKEATCTEKGQEQIACLDCGTIIETNEVAALGHDWGTVTYEWSADNSKCTATRICSRDVSHIETETVNTESHITKNADYENKGEVVFTATFNNAAFVKQTKTIETPVLVWKGFPDVKNGDWFYDAVKYCATRGFITGYKNGKFGPADALQRQDFVVILARIAGADIDGYTSCKLKDVDMNAYYGKAVAWAVDQKIIGGYDNGKFGVGDKITREQVATILYRYMDSPDVDTSVLNKFPDKGSVSSFAVNAIAWANTNGIINGKSDGKLAPTATASRAEIATIIMRMDQQGMFNE